MQISSILNSTLPRKMCFVKHTVAASSFLKLVIEYCFMKSFQNHSSMNFHVLVYI